MMALAAHQRSGSGMLIGEHISLSSPLGAGGMPAQLMHHSKHTIVTLSSGVGDECDDDCDDDIADCYGNAGSAFEGAVGPLGNADNGTNPDDASTAIYRATTTTGHGHEMFLLRRQTSMSGGESLATSPTSAQRSRQTPHSGDTVFLHHDTERRRETTTLV